MKRKQRGKGPHSRPGAPHERDDGRWVQYVTIDGKPYKRVGRTKREVQDKIAALLHSPEQRAARALGPTLAELCAAALAKHDPDSSTHRTYGHALAHWRAQLGEATRRAAITDKSVQAAVDALKATRAPATIATYFAALRVALGADHPALKGITLPQEDDEDEDEASIIVPSDLAERLQATAQHDPLGIAIGLGLGAGLRAGEAAALRWRDVDLARGQLSINGTIKPRRGGWARGKTKSRKTRIVDVSGDLLDWLEIHQRIQADTAALAGYPAPEFVLAAPDTGLGIGRDVPVEVLRRLLAAVCTPEEYALYGALRYHVLRHTHASALLARGASVPDVAARLGITPEVLLRYYTHVLPGAGPRLAALAGELFPIRRPEATREATRSRPSAPQRGVDLSLCKETLSRNDPQHSAGNAPSRENALPDTRSEPQEPAPISNPLSNPEVQP